jgi:hypothetical protein
MPVLAPCATGWVLLRTILAAPQDCDDAVKTVDASELNFQ